IPRCKYHPLSDISELSIPFEYYGNACPLSISAAEIPTPAAALFFQADLLDGHGLVDRLAHVVDSQGGYADGRDGFHLNSGGSKDFDSGRDAQEPVAVEGKIDGHRRDGEEVTEGDEFAGALGRHDAGKAGDFEDIALGHAPVADEGGRGRGHPDDGAGPRDAQG